MQGAEKFNRDLSSWCVSKIPGLPSDFATASALTDITKFPKWGTPCYGGLWVDGVYGTGHRAQGTGHRAQGTGYRAQGIGYRV
jgi:hypothetical protein